MDEVFIAFYAIPTGTAMAWNVNTSSFPSTLFFFNSLALSVNTKCYGITLGLRNSTVGFLITPPPLPVTNNFGRQKK